MRGREPGGQALHDLVAVARTLLARLLDLDDLATNQPVGPDHRGVHTAGDLPPRLLEDPRDPLVEPVIVHALLLHVAIHIIVPWDIEVENPA